MITAELFSVFKVLVEILTKPVSKFAIRNMNKLFLFTELIIGVEGNEHSVIFQDSLLQM